MSANVQRVLNLISVSVFPLLFTSIAIATPYNGTLEGKFSVSPTGAATYTIPIEVPPGINGLQPELALVYNSQAGNGLLGVGWNLAGLSAITRCPRTLEQDGEIRGVKLDSQDRFCLDGQRLILVSGIYGAGGSQYRTEVDSFSKITAYDTIGSNYGPEYFIVETGSGSSIQFGWEGNSNIKQQGGNGTYISWNLAKITDSSGNTIQFTYSSNAVFNNQGYYPLERIDYNSQISGVSTSVRFVYGGRSDVINRNMSGSRLFIPQRMINIKTYVGEQVVNTYRLTYVPSLSKSKLYEITECVADSADCKVAKRFSWQGDASGRLNSYVSTAGGCYGGSCNSLLDGKVHIADFNGDGITDVMYRGGNFDVWLGKGDGTFYSYVSTAGGCYGGSCNSLSDGKVHIADFNGDGITDVMYRGGNFDVWRSGSSTEKGLLTRIKAPVVAGDTIDVSYLPITNKL